MKKKSTALPRTFRPQLPTIVLLAILFFSAYIRVIKLATLPATLNRDEAALAYNALLLKQSGKDEWQRSWPVALESFGDYKLPGYPLIMIGSFTLLGVNDFAVRIPSALAGVGLVGLGYLFARRVVFLSSVGSLFVAFMIAVQPVFLFYSRMAWEANVGLFFLVGAALAFLAQADQKYRIRMDSVGLFLSILAIATYNTPLLLLPFLAIAVVLQRGVKSYRAWLVPVLGLGCIFLAGFLTFASISQQKSSITVFSDETTWLNSVQYYESFSGWQQKVFGNKYVFFAKEITANFIESFSPSFLVQKGGGHPWHSIPGSAHLFIATYSLALAGILRITYLLFFTKQKEQRSSLLAVLFLLASSLAPAVITVDAPHATRSLFFFYLLCVLSGLSMEWLWGIVRRPSVYREPIQVLFVAMFAFGLFNELSRYYSNYFMRYPKQSAEILKAGLGTIVQDFEEKNQQNTEQVAIVDPDGFDYVAVAWALKMPPDKFFSTIQHHLPDRIGLKYGYRVGRYRFIVDAEDRTEEDTHIIEWSPNVKRWALDRDR